MGMKLFYTGNPHSFGERMTDMKNMLLQKDLYDLSTDEGKENTWHAVNGMILGSLVCLVISLIGKAINDPIEKKKHFDECSNAYVLGQNTAYRKMLSDPAFMMDRSFTIVQSDPKKYNMESNKF